MRTGTNWEVKKRRCRDKRRLLHRFKWYLVEITGCSDSKLPALEQSVASTRKLEQLWRREWPPVLVSSTKMSSQKWMSLPCHATCRAKAWHRKRKDLFHVGVGKWLLSTSTSWLQTAVQFQERHKPQQTTWHEYPCKLTKIANCRTKTLGQPPSPPPLLSSSSALLLSSSIVNNNHHSKNKNNNNNIIIIVVGCQHQFHHRILESLFFTKIHTTSKSRTCCLLPGFFSASKVDIFGRRQAVAYIDRWCPVTRLWSCADHRISWGPGAPTFKIKCLCCPVLSCGAEKR